MIEKAIIISISGYKLNKIEKIFKEHLPWGVILFKRILKFSTTKKLILSIKKITKNKHYPILVDEEGGDVSRLKSIIDNKLFSQRYFGKIYEVNSSIGEGIYKYYINELCNIFKSLGININTVPVLDKLYSQTNSFLTNRVFSSKIETIRSLSDICIRAYESNNISIVIKHIWSWFIEI